MKTPLSIPRRVALIVALGTAVACDCPAQEASSRTVETRPQIVLRPPSVEPGLGDPPPGTAPADRPAPSDEELNDRLLEEDLELKERRKARPGEKSSIGHYFVAIAAVVATGIVTLLVKAWLSKRRPS